MTAGRVVGFAMIAGLFLAVFGACAAAVGPFTAAAVFGAVALLMVWIVVGVSLMHPTR